MIWWPFHRPSNGGGTGGGGRAPDSNDSRGHLTDNKVDAWVDLEVAGWGGWWWNDAANTNGERWYGTTDEGPGLATGGVLRLNSDFDEPPSWDGTGTPVKDLAKDGIVYPDGEVTTLGARFWTDDPTMDGTWTLTWEDSKAYVYAPEVVNGQVVFVKKESGWSGQLSALPSAAPYWWGQYGLWACVEAIAPSAAVDDTWFTMSFTPTDGDAVTDTVDCTVYDVDLDVDSDNNDGFAQPGRTPQEDYIEADSDQPGKIVAVNDDDSDADGIVDWADGFDYDGMPDEQSGATDSITQNEKFTPVVFSLGGPFNPATLVLTISYDLSDPNLVTTTGNGTPTSPLTYHLPASGSLRLWTRDGSANRTSKNFDEVSTPAANTGYLVRPGTYDAGTWTKLVQATGGSGMHVNLWVETVRSSDALGDRPIGFVAGVQGGRMELARDQVRLTAFRTRLYSINEAAELSEVEYAELSHPTPQFSNVVTTISNLRLNGDNTRVIGDVTLAGMLDDAASDLIAGADGEINQVTVEINGQFFTLTTNAIKDNDDVSILKPYDFSATFAQTFSGLELQPGTNLIRLTASNFYGLTGFAERAIEVLIGAPADQTYEYEIRITQDPYADPGVGVTMEFRTRMSGDAWAGWRTLARTDASSFFEPNVALGAYIDFIMEGPMDGTGPSQTWATIRDPAAENQGEVVQLTLDRIEDGQAIWRGQWTREEHDLSDLSRHTLSVGEMSPLVVSSGGDFHPVALGIQGPAALREFLDKAKVDESEYDIELYNGRLVFARTGTTVPRALLNTVNLKALTGPVNTPVGDIAQPDDDNGVGQFMLGLGVGFLRTIPDTIIGLWDAAKFIAKAQQEYNLLPIRVGYRYVTTGQFLTPEQTRQMRMVPGVIRSIGEVVLKFEQDRASFISALMTGDDATLHALDDKYRVAFEYAAEMLDSLWDQIVNLSDYEKGKIVGRVIGEVVLTIATTALTGGGALAAKGATMSNVATKLKQVTYLQRFATKFDELIILYNKIDNLTGEIESLARAMGTLKDGKAVSQRIVSLVLRHKERTGAGWWESFEAFLQATAKAERRAKVDSRLAFAASYFQRLAYKEAADIIRANPGNEAKVVEALAKVPSYRRIDEVMMGRRAKAMLETHHTGTEKWVSELIPGITQKQLDEMPAMVMNKYWHQYNSTLPDEYVFHKILREKMASLGNPNDKGQILGALKDTWRQFEGLSPIDRDPDAWVILNAWLDRNMVQP